MTRQSGLARAHGTHGMTRDPFLLMYSWQMRKCTPNGAWAPVIVPSDVTSAWVYLLTVSSREKPEAVIIDRADT